MSAALPRRTATALAGVLVLLLLPVACDRPAQPRRGYWNTVAR